MCISVFSTAHPEYPFILISNRDEFINRPTLRADWWDTPNDHVLGGRDTKRKERGTWLAMTKQGRITILTNFREKGDTHVDMSKSRGGMPNAFLTVAPESEESDEEFVQRLLSYGIHDVGGFTMIFGKLQSPGQHPQMPGLALVSNRTESTKNLKRIATTVGETHAVSNSHFGDNTWPKVVHGEKLLKEAISSSITFGYNQNTFIEHLFDVLSEDALPTRKKDESWDDYVYYMRTSIMIPPAKGAAGQEISSSEGTSTPTPDQLSLGKEAYGTTKQTVILVNTRGEVTFVERTLFEDGKAVDEKDGDRKIQFPIEPW
ncbi:hypothetical protein M409DRAFT_67160 [Zasmidium cellare ATCC 36951]|uniref:DUF833-domain-containing protein n=1 Tax=Zasmidium cellare ATCC 36951 TaxID=1080233 RepID=A0A6A6CI29_ZASCE|nr:uncharacterized protein M409DRAFT_67160 [Zasmidium cellare ATCC 36951]KAF2165840.1 hypothetical protein M409DRAFT_67160 [Zasmidium cellare ATCC 36951]